MEGLTNGTKKPVELGKRKIMKERGELPNEVGDAVRKYKAAMHEENFWSSWLREEDRGKEETRRQQRRKKKGVKRGKEKRRKKRTKRKRTQEDVKVLFRWRPLTFSVKVKI